MLRAGLVGAPFVTVDDTGSRHAGQGCFTTHIGSDRFAAFRTGPGKSRLAFLSRLLGGAARYVINAAAVAYMRAGNLPHDVVDKLAGHALQRFGSHAEWMGHLRALGLTDLQVTPDPVRVASEAALWARAKPRACSAARSSSPTTPSGPRRRPRPVLGSRRAAHPQAPARQRQTAQRHRGRRTDGLVVLPPAQRLQARAEPRAGRAASTPAFRPHLQAPDGLRHPRPSVETQLGRKNELLRVLDRPDIPLNTNASENDIRAFVTKRKISGGTVSGKGRRKPRRHARPRQDLQKTQDPILRLSRRTPGIPGHHIPNLATLVSPAPA